jgi:hypothetical protein
VLGGCGEETEWSGGESNGISCSGGGGGGSIGGGGGSTTAAAASAAAINAARTAVKSKNAVL